MISKTARHAIRALVRLAQLPEGHFAGALGLARDIDAPGNYLGKLLQALARQGLVQSRKGHGGGFRLARAPASIALLDIVDPIDSVRSWDSCLLGGSACSEESPCAVHARWAALRDSYRTLLSGTTLAEVVEHATEIPGFDRADHERSSLKPLKEFDR